MAFPSCYVLSVLWVLEIVYYYCNSVTRGEYIASEGKRHVETLSRLLLQKFVKMCQTTSGFPDRFSLETLKATLVSSWLWWYGITWIYSHKTDLNQGKSKCTSPGNDAAGNEQPPTGTQYIKCYSIFTICLLCLPAIETCGTVSKGNDRI